MFAISRLHCTFKNRLHTIHYSFFFLFLLELHAIWGILRRKKNHKFRNSNENTEKHHDAEAAVISCIRFKIIMCGNSLQSFVWHQMHLTNISELCFELSSIRNLHSIPFLNLKKKKWVKTSWYKRNRPNYSNRLKWTRFLFHSKLMIWRST